MNEIQGKVENPRKFGGDGAPESTEDNLQATPDEQQDYEMLVVRGRKIIFGEDKESILEMLGSSETPAKGIGQSASMIVKSLTSAAKEQGREIGADAAINAGSLIASDLNDLGKANGVFQYDSQEDEDQELKDGLLWGIKTYGEGMIQSGELTPEIQDSAKKQVTAAIQEDANKGLQKTPMASAVDKAINQPPQGLINSALKKGG